MTSPHGLSAGQMVVQLAMALGRIEEICYATPRTSDGSRAVRILGVIHHVKIILTDGDPFEPEPEPEPAPPVPPDPTITTADGRRAEDFFGPGPITDGVHQPWGNLRAAPDPYRDDSADTAVMDPIR